jgi:hypothetical protein
MNLLVTLLFAGCAITIVISVQKLEKKMKHFRETIAKKYQTAYELATVPYKQTKKIFIIYSIALVVTTICLSWFLIHFTT